jgi:hypothetical protein
VRPTAFWDVAPRSLVRGSRNLHLQVCSRGSSFSRSVRTCVPDCTASHPITGQVQFSKQESVSGMVYGLKILGLSEMTKVSGKGPKKRLLRSGHMTWRLRCPHLCFCFQNRLSFALLRAKLSQGTNFLKLLILVFHGDSLIILISALGSLYHVDVSSIVDVSELHAASNNRMGVKWVSARIFSISLTKSWRGGNGGSRRPFLAI